MPVTDEQGQVPEKVDCSYCNTIQWGSFQNWRKGGGFWNKDNRPVLNPEKMNPVDCVVCRTLKSMCLDQRCNMLTYYERDLDPQPCKNFGNPITGTLRVSNSDGSYESSAYIALLRGDEKPFKACTERIEWAALQEEVNRCSEYHYQYGCVVLKRAPIQGLRVIDCLGNKVIMPPDDCTYLALSYVWGANPGSNETYEFPELPKVLEQTIQDAVTVTVKLGFRYLWVDRYCIDQKDASAKHHQIQQMWGVYASAEMTLIAAVGDSPNHGLPGVSVTRTEDRWSEQRGPVTLFSRYTSEIDDIVNSVWASRAWTFQENYISQRRLFFTESSAFFVCREGLKTEDGKIKTGAIRIIQGVPTSLAFHEMLALSLVTATAHQEPYKKRSGARKCIEAYSRRKLSYDSDALNAVLGVLDHLSDDEDCPISNMWGMLVASVDRTGPFRHRFLGAYEVSLHWFHPGFCRRRAGFPTWSPIAWEGPLNYTGDLSAPNTVPMVPSDYDIVVLSGDRLQSMREYVETGRINDDADQLSAPKLLGFKRIRTFPLRFELGTLSLTAVLSLEKDLDITCSVFWDQEPIDSELDRLIGAVITTYQHGDISIMILKPHEGRYERVGMILWGYRLGTYSVRDRRTGRTKTVRSSRDRIMSPPEFISEERRDIIVG